MDWKEELARLAAGGAIDPAPETEENIDATEDKTGVKAGDKGAEAPRQTGKLNVVVEKKGRKGKTATIIEGFTLPDEEVERIASELKRRIGTGGSARGGEILLQGDWRDRVKALLKEIIGI